MTQDSRWFRFQQGVWRYAFPIIGPIIIVGACFLAGSTYIILYSVTKMAQLGKADEIPSYFLRVDTSIYHTSPLAFYSFFVVTAGVILLVSSSFFQWALRASMVFLEDKLNGRVGDKGLKGQLGVNLGVVSYTTDTRVRVKSLINAL